MPSLEAAELWFTCRLTAFLAATALCLIFLPTLEAAELTSWPTLEAAELTSWPTLETAAPVLLVKLALDELICADARIEAPKRLTATAVLRMLDFILFLHG